MDVSQAESLVAMAVQQADAAANSAPPDTKQAKALASLAASMAAIAAVIVAEAKED